MSRDRRNDTPTTWGRFRAGTLPCASCGIAVPGRDADRMDVLTIENGTVPVTFHDDYPVRYVPRTFDKLVSRCDDCQKIHEHAAELVAENPEVRGVIGDPEIAVWRVELSLIALDALGITDPRVLAKLTGGPRALIRLIAAFAIPGGMARWAFGVRAGRPSEVDKTPPSATRWAHISPGVRRALNEANVHLFVQNNEKPADFACPSDDGAPAGCMLCGVEAWRALPSYERDHGIWVEMEADAESIGGQRGPSTLDGYVCPRCDVAIDRAEAVGQTAMNYSVHDFLGVSAHLRGISMFNLVAWAVLPRGTAPNAEPWAHMDLGPIREEVGSLGVATAVGDYQPLQRIR